MFELKIIKNLLIYKMELAKFINDNIYLYNYLYTQLDNIKYFSLQKFFQISYLNNSSRLNIIRIIN